MVCTHIHTLSQRYAHKYAILLIEIRNTHTHTDRPNRINTHMTHATHATSTTLSHTHTHSLTLTHIGQGLDPTKSTRRSVARKAR